MKNDHQKYGHDNALKMWVVFKQNMRTDVRWHMCSVHFLISNADCQRQPLAWLEWKFNHKHFVKCIYSTIYGSEINAFWLLSIVTSAHRAKISLYLFLSHSSVWLFLFKFCLLFRFPRRNCFLGREFFLNNKTVKIVQVLRIVYLLTYT